MAIAPRSILAALICGLLVVFCSPAALAHDSLKASSPAKDATVTSLDAIELEFTSRVRMPFVALRDAGDRQVDLGEPRVEGKFVRTEVPEPLPAGKYVIAWRVVSSDGHPIEGEIPFTAEGEPSPEPSTPTPAAERSTPPSVSAETTAPAAPESSAVAAAEAGDGIPGWIWVAAAALALVGVGLGLAGSRAKRPE